MTVLVELTHKNEPSDMRKAADADVVLLVGGGVIVVWKDRHNEVEIVR